MLGQLFLENTAFSKKHTYLVAVSGGRDSMALLHLLNTNGYNCVAAHCNYQLRESAHKDEQLIEKFCLVNQIVFTSIRFNTEEEKQAGESIQMVARRLRYAWFESQFEKYNCEAILTAHHLQDSLETVLYNLSNGTGIGGLTGISFQQNNVIRPFIKNTREEIDAYVTAQAIPFNEDESNASLKYNRNKVRQQILPILLELNPNLIGTFRQTENNLQYANSLYKQRLKKVKAKFKKPTSQGWVIYSKQILAHAYPPELLYDLINEHGFTMSQVQDILKACKHKEAKLFKGLNCDLLKDRNSLTITSNEETNLKNYFIEEGDSKIMFNGNLLNIVNQDTSATKISPSKKMAFLDSVKLTYPLLLRPWQTGDYFYPFGLNKKKKVARFLIDSKLNVLEKRSTYVLCSAGKVIWLVGHRIDHRFSLQENTKSATVFTLQQ